MAGDRIQQVGGRAADEVRVMAGDAMRGDELPRVGVRDGFDRDGGGGRELWSNINRRVGNMRVMRSWQIQNDNRH